MERRVAQGLPPDGPADRSPGPDGGASSAWVGIGGAVGFGLVALVAYAIGDEGTVRLYNHFVWQALAFLDGRAAIDYPVPENEFFQDVLPLTGPNGEPTGRGLIPFPPLPAILLMPFVTIWGLRTDAQAVAGVLGAVDVMIAWWMLGRLPITLPVRAVTTAFFAFGTVFLYTAELGTTWYFAHVVAVGLALAAVGLALGADPRAGREEPGVTEGEVAERGASGGGRVRSTFGRLSGLIDRRQLVVGLLFGLACTARLTIAFAGPFFLLVGGGRTWLARGVSTAIGAAIPVGALVLYNVVSTGQVFHPAYEYLYLAEAAGYPSLGYNLSWGIQDPRYIPQNLQIALLSAPVLLPDTVPAALGSHTPLCTEPGAVRALFDEDCPLILPRDTGMSLLLTSPAYLLAVPAIRHGYGRSRLVTGAAVAVLLVFVVNLMHFSQGWVQFGYRFSNDFVAFALPLVALGIQRLRHRRLLVAGLVTASIAVNVWGAVWGALLGW